MSRFESKNLLTETEKMAHRDVGWRDMDNKEPRFAGRQRLLDELFTAVRMSRPDDASEFPMETAAVQRRNPKKKTTIKQLFSAASKFQKNLRR